MNKKEEQINNELTILSLIEEITSIDKSYLYEIVEKDVKLYEKLNLIKDRNPSGKLRKEAKDKLNSILKRLKTKELIKDHKNDQDHDCYILTEKGKQVIIQGLSTNLPVEVKQKEEENQWIIWTNPIFVEKNNRWEFYQQDQKEQVLNIYHSEDEQEIKDMHKQKVAEHIMASLKGEEKKGKYKHKKEENTENDIQPPKEKEKPKKRSNTSNFIHQDIKFNIMRLKLEGSSFLEIVDYITKEYRVSSITVGDYYIQVLKEIRDRTRDLLNDTIKTHLERYEVLYQWFRDNGYARAALKVLERREKIIGLSSNEMSEGGVMSGVVKMLLENNLNGLNKNLLGEVIYDLSRLSDEERRRMEVLIGKVVVVIDRKETNKTIL